MNLSRIIFIVGPTAVGKTAVASALAQDLNGEIVSCDAMQVYKEIHIASNKPPQDTLKKIPHHMLSVISIAKEFDVASYSRKALAAIRQIQRKGPVPVICGGSGLYLSVLLDGIFEGVGRDDKIRRALEKEAAKNGLGCLYNRLKIVDPAAAAKIHINDAKRIIRALEVFSISGHPISQLRRQRRGLWGQSDIVMFALDRPREELYGKINRRVDQMIKEGLVDEVLSLKKRKWSRTAKTIIGVREIEGYLKGNCSLEQAADLIKLNTRHYAKRQLTWFRKDKRLQWISIPKNEAARKTAVRIRKAAQI